MAGILQAGQNPSNNRHAKATIKNDYRIGIFHHHPVAAGINGGLEPNRHR